MGNSNNSYESFSSGYFFNEGNQKQLIKIDFIDEKIEFRNHVYKELYFNDIKGINKISDEIIADYGEVAAKYTAVIMFVLMSIYNVFIGDSLAGAVLGGVVSALIYGGIAFVIGKFFKVKYARLIMFTLNDDKVEVAISGIDLERILSIIDLELNARNDLRIPRKESFNKNSTYDDLLKIKELLDKGILTNDEFENEKRKLLSKL